MLNWRLSVIDAKIYCLKVEGLNLAKIRLHLSDLINTLKETSDTWKTIKIIIRSLMDNGEKK